MTGAPGRDPDLQVKSSERVRDLGEVFTPPNTVEVMLDLIPDELWQPHPSSTFLEPACGDGNFLVAVLARKLDAIAREYARGNLAAGTTSEAAQFHVLEALASVYAVDISADNVIGGTPGHEVGARQRMLAQLCRWHSRELGLLADDSPLVVAARWVVERNIQIGNMMATNPDGTPSGRGDLPLIEYAWEPETLTVGLYTTTLGAVAAESEAAVSETLSLFGPPEPILVWSGRAFQIHEAPIEAPRSHVKHSRNGNEVR